MKKDTKHHLPKHAPKKTGKRGIKPVEREEKATEALQADLPGLEDRAIAELEAAAEEYAGIRDRRMALTEQEVECKEKLLALMHGHGKQTYIHGGIEIRVVAEKEKVRVRIHKDE